MIIDFRLSRQLAAFYSHSWTYCALGFMSKEIPHMTNPFYHISRAFSTSLCFKHQPLFLQPLGYTNLKSIFSTIQVLGVEHSATNLSHIRSFLSMAIIDPQEFTDIF